MKEQFEIEEMTDRVSDMINSGQNRYPSMSYEEGFRAALEWVLGQYDEEEEDPFQ